MPELTFDNTPRHESEPQDPLWQEMVDDVHVLMNHPVDDPERQSWLDEKAKTKGEYDFLKDITFKPISAESGKEKPDFNFKKFTFDRDFHLRFGLLAQRMHIPKYYVLNRRFNLDIQTGDPNPRCTWMQGGTASETNFQVFVDRTDHPHAQEELLHAAQEVLIKNPESMSHATRKTSEQLVHTSFVLDMAMSLAAVEEGTWDEWHQRARGLQQQERSRLVRTDDWDKTLVGKGLNQRFQFKDMSLADVGLYWRNLGKYFDDMFDEVGGITNHEMVEVFEFCCLAYGANHRDLSYSMVDLPVDEKMTDEEAGRVVVDWAKRVMTYFAESGNVNELLSHHTDVTEIPEHYFNYDVPDYPLKTLTDAVEDPDVPLPSKINISTLKSISMANWGKKVTAMIEAWKRVEEGGSSDQLDRVLDESGVSRDVFDMLVRQAEASYKRQFVDTEELVDPGFAEYREMPKDLLYKKFDFKKYLDRDNNQ